MSNLPIVIVLSKGEINPEEIIKNIRKAAPDADRIDLLPNTTIHGYNYNITTKYYKTDIVFVPFDEDISDFPSQLNSQVEGLFVYFNSNDRTFLESIENYATYLESACLELGILLCDKLADDEKEGITYREVKQISKLLDVIELARTKDDEEVEVNSDHHDPVGYDEVQQVLRSFLWSNVQADINQAGNSKQLDIFDDSSSTDVPQEQDIEKELAGFETLLSELMAFKNNSVGLTRNERLAYTQGFADAFDHLIGDGSSSSDEESAAAATPD